MKKKADAILQIFKDLGVRLHPCSRIAQQIGVYLDSKGTLPQIIEPDHPSFQTAVEAQRDLNQIGFALQQLLPVVPKEEMKRRLGRLVGDNILPQDSPELSPGRDAQLEMFSAALCMRGRLAPVFDESPDLRCTVANQIFGVAIKRIKARPERFRDRFKRRVREAAEQIATSKLPGVIIADISQSRNPTNWRVPLEVSDSDFDESRRSEVLRFRNQFEAPLHEWTRGKHVRGIILIDHILRSHSAAGWRLELSAWSMSLCPFNQRRRQEFELFARQFNEAVSDPGESW